MNILLWIVFGALAGWLASIVMGKSGDMGAVANIVIGILGAGVGGLIASALGIGGIDGFNLTSLLIAVGGACVCLLIINGLRRLSH